MPRSTLVSLPFVMALALMAGCGATTLGADGAAGGSAAGAGGGAAGAGGGVAGAAAGNGGGGGAPLTSCPAGRPISGTPCVAPLTCNFIDAVHCNLACTSDYQCMNGRIVFLGSSDGCFQLTCSPDAGTDAAVDAGSDAATAATVCTPGADQTCNDNPIWSSIHGRCTDAGVCLCNDAGTNPDSGRCL